MRVGGLRVEVGFVGPAGRLGLPQFPGGALQVKGGANARVRAGQVHTRTQGLRLDWEGSCRTD